MKTTIQNKVAAFDQVLGFCNAIGSRYQPTKLSINPPALNKTLDRAKLSVDAVQKCWKANADAIGKRSHEYRKLTPLATRVVNTLRLSGAPPHIMEEARSLKHKFYYRKSKNALKHPVETVESAKGNPAVQLNYLSVAELFSKLVDVAKLHPGYATNEIDLSIEGLEKHVAMLNRLSDQVRISATNLSIARNKRNKLLKEITTTASDVKVYVRTTFGHKSDEYLFLTKIKFN
ncbi:MAG TPA: hypothetical protein VD927_11180 [Chryseosolibacter sp.]|nr:hypothetical protein [Chryseosolibacter sp.]